MDTDLAKHFDSVGQFRARLNRDCPQETNETKQSEVEVLKSPTNRVFSKRLTSRLRSMDSIHSGIQTNLDNGTLKDKQESSIDPNNPEDKLLILRMAVKAADVAHPCKSQALHLCWTARVTREFYSK